MNSSSGRPGPGILLLGALGLAYPFLVTLSMDHVPAGALVPAALALAAGRLLALRRTRAARAMVPALGMVLACLLGLSALDAEAAVLGYPVAMNWGMAGAFGLSLRHPPCLVEGFAALTEPDPTPKARAYMRQVCLVWFLFLAVNGAVSLLTVLSGDRVLWALYNGLVSYVLMGGVFLAEYGVRRRIRAREASP